MIENERIRAKFGNIKTCATKVESKRATGKTPVHSCQEMKKEKIQGKSGQVFSKTIIEQSPKSTQIKSFFKMRFSSNSKTFRENVKMKLSFTILL